MAMLFIFEEVDELGALLPGLWVIVVLQAHGTLEAEATETHAAADHAAEWDHEGNAVDGPECLAFVLFVIALLVRFQAQVRLVYACFILTWSFIATLFLKLSQRLAIQLVEIFAEGSWESQLYCKNC